MTNQSKKTRKNPRRLAQFRDPRVYFPPLDGGGKVSLPAAEAAAVTASSIRTVNRWRRAGRVPPAPLRLLQLHYSGFIVPAAWREAGGGFNRLGELCVGRYVFRFSELDGYGVMLQALRALQQDRERGVQPPLQRPLLVVLPGGQRGG